MRSVIREILRGEDLMSGSRLKGVERGRRKSSGIKILLDRNCEFVSREHGLKFAR